LFGQEEVSIASLQQEPFVAFTCAVDGGNFEPMDMLRSGSNLGQRVVGSSSHLEEVRRLIMSGLGIGILPITAVEQDVAAGSIYPLPTLQGSIGADVYMVTNPNVELRTVERTYLGVVDELLALSSTSAS
ncbi:MAG TPA: LysR substrate-binding domain-containing protein, partial [Tianweitania sediminis]|nr:LysR substrate-binding domain-containing protein [Tianweitania sediminis]